MLKKIMASLGVGSARVNLVLEKGQYRIGETVKGKMIIEGGNVDQEIKALDVDVTLKFKVRGREFTKVAQTITVSRIFQVRAGMRREVPFDFYLPADYPVSKGAVWYYLVTRMDIARSVDTSDSDGLVVLPGKEMALLFDAMDILGFREKIGSGRIERLGQEFIYYPTAVFSDQLREMGFKFFSGGGHIKLLLDFKLTGVGNYYGAAHHTELPLPGELLRDEAVGQLAGHIKGFLEDELLRVSVEGPRPAPDYRTYQHNTVRPGVGGFIGGMAAGLLGAMVLSSIFDDGDNQGEEDANDAGGDFEEDGGFEFGFEDFGDDTF